MNDFQSESTEAYLISLKDVCDGKSLIELIQYKEYLLEDELYEMADGITKAISFCEKNTIKSIKNEITRQMNYIGKECRSRWSPYH